MKMQRVILLALPLLLLIGCATTAVSTARKYFAALEERDFETAKKFVASGSYEAFEWLELDEEKHTYKVLRQEEASETESTVYYTVDGNPTERTIKVVKVDDLWLVELSGEDK